MRTAGGDGASGSGPTDGYATSEIPAAQLALLGLFAVYAATGAAGPPGVLWVHLAIGAVLLAAGFARTIVEDVRVVAIDRQVGSGADSPGGGEDGEIVCTEIVTATLEASPAQGDRLVLGEHEGRLSLAVRSLAAVTVAQNASEAEAVDLREMLLSSPEFTASNAWTVLEDARTGTELGKAVRARRRLPKRVEVLVHRLIRDVGIVPADLAAGAERAFRARAITPG